MEEAEWAESWSYDVAQVKTTKFIESSEKHTKIRIFRGQPNRTPDENE